MSIKNKADINKKIDELIVTLKLNGIKSVYKDEINEALIKESSYEEFLYKILEKEHDIRNENAKYSRIRIANFPYKKYIEDLVIADLPDDAQRKINILSSLNFIKTGQNIILAGNPGTGKTHIGIGLGIRACLEGFKVLFVTVANLINQLKECKSQKTLMSFQNKLEKYDLIIIDELGYISFDKEGSELLFTSLSGRAGRKSTIVTTNLEFERWDEIFNDPIMTAAMVDRLTHKSYLINMNGNSYRLKETQEWLKEQC